jgi:hypothetical protein
MRRYIFLIVLLVALLTAKSHAQILHPVKWSYGSKKIDAHTAVVFFKATIDPGWHVYSQTVKEGGPIKTSFDFDRSSAYTLVGNTIEPNPIVKNEPVFGMEVGYFEKEVIFQQKIKLKSKTVVLKGSLNFMTCNDRQCLPPENVNFSVIVK